MRLIHRMHFELEHFQFNYELRIVHGQFKLKIVLIASSSYFFCIITVAIKNIFSPHYDQVFSRPFPENNVHCRSSQMLIFRIFKNRFVYANEGWVILVEIYSITLKTTCMQRVDWRGLFGLDSCFPHFFFTRVMQFIKEINKKNVSFSHISSEKKIINYNCIMIQFFLLCRFVYYIFRWTYNGVRVFFFKTRVIVFYSSNSRVVKLQWFAIFCCCWFCKSSLDYVYFFKI